MKAKTNVLLIVVALLAYWAGLCNASAFYDPGTQRWLNRDPLDEIGFEALRKHKVFHNSRAFIQVGELVNGLNYFLYVKNEPLQFEDPLGLDVMPDVDMQTCMANCDAAYKCAPGFVKALADHALASTIGAILGVTSCALAFSADGTSLVLDGACLGSLGIEAYEAAAIIQEAKALANKAKGNLASCLGKCAKKYNDWDDAREDWFDHFPASNPPAVHGRSF